MSFLLTVIGIILAVVLIVIAVIVAYYIINSPSTTEIDGLKKWLQYAVTLAEKDFGSGTGQLKLRFVYQLFVEKFPTLAKYISFNTISTYVDEALEWLNNQLTSNKSVASYVGTSIPVTTDELYFATEGDDDDIDPSADDVTITAESTDDDAS